MLRVLLLSLIVSPAWAGAFGFSIKEQRDDFTGTTYIVGDNLKVCQPSGFATSCASMYIAWTPEKPDVALVRLEVHTLASVLSLSSKTPDGIRTFDADTPVTDRKVSSGFWSSANQFVIPIDILETIASDPAYGVIRVTGTHSSIDFSFYRKASAKGLPVDHLKTFLERIKGSNHE